MIHFSADWHLNHASVLKWCPERAAQFADIGEMDEHFISECNRVVKPNDELRILGDWFWSTKKYGYYRAKLKVRKIHVVLGNHDSKSIAKYVSTCKEVDYPKIDGIRFHLFHCPIFSWRGREKAGSIHLYGHSHTRSEAFLNEHFPNRRAIDVGIDNAFRLLGEWRPFSLDEILWALGIKRCPICRGIDPRHIRGCPKFQHGISDN